MGGPSQGGQSRRVDFSWTRCACPHPSNRATRRTSLEPGAWSLTLVSAQEEPFDMDEDTARSLVGDDPAVALQGQDPSGA